MKGPIDEKNGEHVTLGVSDFPATQFFIHLSRGTRYFRDKEFEKAITEWEAATRLRPELVRLKKIPGSILFKGDLGQVPLLGFLYAVYSNGQTGIAIVRNEFAFKEVFFKEGWIVFARTTKTEERIGNLLLRREVISEESLERLALQAKKEGKKLGFFLVEKGFLSERELQEILEFQVKEILCDLFTWREGEFFFAEKEVGDEDVVVSYTPLDIALMAARRALDFSTFRKMIPHNRVIFRISPHIERNKEKVTEKLDANEKFIFSLIDGTRNIDQLIRFSGNDEISVINILYRLVTMGLITKSKDIGVYEDQAYKEISGFLTTLVKILESFVKAMETEIGVKARELVEKAKGKLSLDYQKVFLNYPPKEEKRFEPSIILRNISRYFPDPDKRFVFIDAFYELFTHLLDDMNRILGETWTKKVVHELEVYRSEVHRIYPDSPNKRKLVSYLDKLTALYGG